MVAATSVHVVAIIEPIIQHADWFFPDGTFQVHTVSFSNSCKQNYLKSNMYLTCVFVSGGSTAAGHMGAIAPLLVHFMLLFPHS